MVQIRSVKFDVRKIGEEAGGESGHFEGYAAVFGNRDSYGSIVDKGAFARTIKHNNGKFPVVWFHDPTTPIGIASVREDDHGLYVEADLDLNVEQARNVYSGMKKGYIDRMSFAFDVVQDEEDKNGVTHFKELKLYEVSPLTRNFASNELALITEVRSRKLSELPDDVAEEIRKIRQADRSTDFDTNLKGMDLRERLWQIIDALTNSIYSTMKSKEIEDKAAKIAENVDSFKEAIVAWAREAQESGIYDEERSVLLQDLEEIRAILTDPEQRVGKVLSKANREKVEDAISSMEAASSSLRALLDAADAADSARTTPSQGSEPATDEPDGERQDTPDNQSDPDDEIHSLSEIIEGIRADNQAWLEENSRRRLEAIVRSLRRE